MVQPWMDGFDIEEAMAVHGLTHLEPKKSLSRSLVEPMLNAEFLVW